MFINQASGNLMKVNNFDVDEWNDFNIEDISAEYWPLSTQWDSSPEPGSPIAGQYPRTLEQFFVDMVLPLPDNEAEELDINEVDHDMVDGTEHTRSADNNDGPPPYTKFDYHFN
jgi:hypothetical protein